MLFRSFRKGIDVRSGESQIRNLSGLDNVVTNNFVTTSSEFIDGVFVPDGQDGLAEITVSSTGLTVSGLNKTSGAAWDLIRNGPVASQHSPELGGIDFTKEGHSLLGLHANSGITFDIEAIRKSHNASNLRFTAKVGYFGASGGFRADAWIYLDGNLLAKFSHLGRDQGLQEIDLEIPLHSRFLTLISTDGGNGYGHDQIGFGDPVLKSDESVELSTEDQQRLTDLRLERISTQQQLSSLEAPPKFYGVVTKKDSTPVYFRVPLRSSACTRGTEVTFDARS